MSNGIPKDLKEIFDHLHEIWQENYFNGHSEGRNIDVLLTKIDGHLKHFIKTRYNIDLDSDKKSAMESNEVEKVALKETARGMLEYFRNKSRQPL
ncbi:MAG: hypothetical protein V3V00_10460 [Saprospiraceae bacterium]